MTFTIEELNIKKVFPCDEHKYLIRKQNIILMLLVFDILMSIINNGVSYILINLLLKVF